LTSVFGIGIIIAVGHVTEGETCKTYHLDALDFVRPWPDQDLEVSSSLLKRNINNIVSLSFLQALKVSGIFLAMENQQQHRFSLPIYSCDSSLKRGGLVRVGRGEVRRFVRVPRQVEEPTGLTAVAGDPWTFVE